MIHDLKPYPAYKDSGVPWLGQVPEHWEVRRTKTLLRERVQKGFPDEPLLAATQTKGVVRKDQYENRTVLALKDLHLLKLVRVGDFVISLRSFQGGIEYAREQGIISPAYTVLYPAQPDTHGFLAWLFKSKPYIENLSLYVTGIRQGQNIDYEKLSRSRLPAPPLPDQFAIVRFLDYVDRRIGRYIRIKQKLIKLLEEQKQALIHRAVTRGLDPNVRLKPSGIPWLGDIPQHWEVRRLKHLAWFQSGDGITSLQIEATGPYPVYGGNGLRGYTTRHTHDGHYALIGRQGALCGNINYARGQFFASEHAVVATLQAGLSVVWFGELLKVMNLNQYSQSAAQPGLAVERIKNLYAPVPPVGEQHTMAESVERTTAPLIIAIDHARSEIALLREYHTRLIADVVTGKLDVREAVVRLPEEADEPELPADSDAVVEGDEDTADSNLDAAKEEMET